MQLLLTRQNVHFCQFQVVYYKAEGRNVEEVLKALCLLKPHDIAHGDLAKLVRTGKSPADIAVEEAKILAVAEQKIRFAVTDAVLQALEMLVFMHLHGVFHRRPVPRKCIHRCGWLPDRGVVLTPDEVKGVVKSTVDNYDMLVCFPHFGSNC